MAALMKTSRFLCRSYFGGFRRYLARSYSSKSPDNEMNEGITEGNEQDIDDRNEFATLLRNSKLMQIGDPVGRHVVGTVVNIIGSDLYIDYGGKFYAVCKKPVKPGKEGTYNVGTKVRLELRDIEICEKSEEFGKYVTFCETDAVLLGTYSKRNKQR